MLVHAENDGTMPWDQTEELFKTTLRAATNEVGPNVKIADLGEAGKQEVWCQGTRSISKLIAKHGGKWFLHDFHLQIERNCYSNTTQTITR